MSSVATRRCRNASRIVCWRASLREKTTTSSGTPTSPSRRRRTNTWPRDPVPPVTMTRLPSSKDLPDARVLRRARGELGHHLRPARRRPARGLAEPGGVEAAVDHDALIPLDLDLELEGVAQELEEIMLRDRLGAHVVAPLQRG